MARVKETRLPQIVDRSYQRSGSYEWLKLLKIDARLEIS